MFYMTTPEEIRAKIEEIDERLEKSKAIIDANAGRIICGAEAEVYNRLCYLTVKLMIARSRLELQARMME